MQTRTRRTLAGAVLAGAASASYAHEGAPVRNGYAPDHVGMSIGWAGYRANDYERDMDCSGKGCDKDGDTVGVFSQWDRGEN